ncbi:MAG: hypothetical protein IJB91_05590 [Oscillospiraceae bacterium]|nr:hypothetical protein [Oscillospiraceae bacterium]
MKPMLIFPAGTTGAVRYASDVLHKAGVALIDHPAPEITHLLLDVPSFSPEGNLRNGSDFPPLLERLPESITVIGGNLSHSALEGYRKYDLLTDEDYLAQNAAITAECALRIAGSRLNATFRDTPALVIGWGRIGKYLTQLLMAMHTPVCVAVRNKKDQALLNALGYRAIGMDAALGGFRLIFNTVPEIVFPEEIPKCRDCVKIDLASRKGLEGDDVIRAKGLPGVLAPESSGRLIAGSILRLRKEEQL